MVVVTASAASAARMAQEGAGDLLSFEGFAGKATSGQPVPVPDGLPTTAVSRRAVDPPGVEYVAVVWNRGRVVGTVYVAGQHGDLSGELAQLARLQDHRMKAFK